MSVFDLPTLGSVGALAPPSLPPPTAGRVPAAADDRSNAFIAGIKSGGYGLAAGAAGFGSNIAKLVGASDTSASLGQAAAGFNQDAVTAGRPDLDQKSYFGGGLGQFASKAAYAAGQFLPGVAAIGGAAAAAPFIAPEAAGAAALGEGAEVAGGLASRIGSLVPKFLGGGGADAAANSALGKAIIGGSAVSVPTTIGDLTNQQAQTPGGLTYGKAAAAFGLGIPAGVAGALAPGEGAVLARGADQAVGGVVHNFVDHGLKNAALGAIGGGVQAAASEAINPATTLSEKAGAVVQGAVSGAVAGGLIGGAAGAAGPALSKLFGDRTASSSDQATAVGDTLAAAGLDPKDPSAGTKPAAPTPPPAPAGGGEAVSPVDPSTLGGGAPAVTAPDGGPPRISGGSYKEHLAAVALRDGTLDPSTLPIAQPEPPQTVIQKALADAGITKFSSKGDLGKFVANSTATSLPELFNEVSAAGDKSEALAGGRLFGKLASHLGAGIPDLEDQLVKARAAEKPDQATIDTLNRQLAIRDAAQALRPPEPAPPEVMPAAAEGAPAGPVAAGAPPVRDAAAGRTITAPSFEGDIPELQPAERGTSPAVPTDTQVQPNDGGVKVLGPELNAPLPPLAGSERAPAPGEIRPVEPDAGVTPADTGPLSVADKVLAVARAAVGDKGGEVDIASIRAALPDIHANDLENALRDIHGDDTENTLTQNPKGQRKGVDGVSVDGQGKFQKLELEPRTPDAAEVGSAAPEAGADQPGSPAAAGGGDPAGEPATGASAAQAETEGGQQGAPEPAGQGAASPPVADVSAVRSTFDQFKAAAADLVTEQPGMAKAVKSTIAQTQGHIDGVGTGDYGRYDTVKKARIDTLRAYTADETPAFARVKELAGQVSDQLENARDAVRTPDDPWYRDQAIQTKLDPQPEVEPSPVQQVQTAAKTQASANILAANTDATAAGKPLVQKLRKQSRAKTAMIETPEHGDQVPTESVGGTTADMAQATASSTDPLAPAGPPDILSKVPSDRVPGVVDNHPILPREQVEAHVAKFVAKLRPELQDNVHVVGTASELPKNVLDAGARSGHDFNTNTGLFYDNQAYVIADQMRNLGEVEDTISHEVFGHMANAVRYPKSSDFGSALSRIYDKVDGPEGGGFERAARKAGLWDQFEDGHNLNGGIGIKSYIPTTFPEGLDRATPMQKARAMDELMAHKAGQTPSKFDDMISSFQVQAKKAIVNTLRRAGMSNFASRLDTFGQAELAKWIADSRAALRQQPKPGDIDMAALSSDPRTFIHDSDPLGAAPFMSRIAGQQRDLQGLTGLVGSMRDKMEGTGFYEKVLLGGVRGFKSWTAPAAEMAETAKRINLPGIDEHYDLNQPKSAMSTRWSYTQSVVHQGAKLLQGQDKVQYGRMNELASIATQEGIYAQRPFEAHTWLINGKTPEQVAASRAQHEKAQGLFNDLGNATKGGKKTPGQQIYLDHITAGEANWHMSRAAATQKFLEDMGFGDRHDLGKAPGENYAVANDAHGNVNKTLDFAKAEYERTQGLAKAISGSEGTLKENIGTPLYDALKSIVDNNDNGRREMTQEGPYFHLGRQGDTAFAGRIKPELDAEGKPTGRADPASLEAIRAYVDKKFPQVSIGRANLNNAIFAKFDNENIAGKFHSAFIKGGPLWEHMDQEHDIRIDPISKSTPEGSLPALERLEEATRAQYAVELKGLDPASPQYAARAVEREKALGTLRATMNDLIGEGSARSLQSKRENVQGYNTDVMTSQQLPAATTARAIAEAAVQSRQAEGLAKARAAIDESGNRGDKGAPVRTARMQRVYDDYSLRNEAAAKRVTTSYLSTIRSAMHTYQLAASPAYVLLNLGQLWTLGLPELSRYHGFAKSSLAMAQSVPEALKMMSAMIAKIPQAEEQIGPNTTRATKFGRSVSHGGITNRVLDHAGFSSKVRAFHEAQSNLGNYELGSYSMHNSGTNIGALNAVQRWMHYANSVPLLAETFCRVLTATAARRLYDGATPQVLEAINRNHPDVHSYATRVINQSCLEWGSHNTSRFMTAGGPLGQASPVAFQFHGFVPKIASELYRNALDGYTSRLKDSLSGDAYLAARKEAQRFTNAHLATVMGVGGAMGLPLVSTMLGAATRVSGFTGNQPVDFQAGTRDFLSNTFGKEAGEVIAHGLPRYLGSDLSSLGDENWAPFAKLIEDRQKFEDAWKDYATHAWGSSASAAVNMVLAGRDMSEGRFMEAGARAMPTAIRNVVRAAQIEKRGYVNAKGTPLPVEGTTREVEAMKQLLGLESGQLAEERERQGALSGLKNDRQEIQTRIEQKYLLAQNAGDETGKQDAIAEAKKFGQDNPGMNMMGSLGTMVQQQAQAAALGRETGVLGLRPQDRLGHQVSNF